MAEQIVSIADIEDRARRDFEHKITECPYPWNSEARIIWQWIYGQLRDKSRTRN
jgi:hypothetical protein